MNDRSELVTPTNFSDGGVFATSRRFQAAWPASMSPARSPTRASLPGAGVDRRSPALLDDEAHAARENTAIASERERSGPRTVRADSMADSCEGSEWTVAGRRAPHGLRSRSEERRVGKECRSRRWRYQ